MSAYWLLPLAYLLGAVPFGYLLCKLVYKVDIRELGSGNIGATNVMRSVGKWPALAVLLLDAGKGFLPVFLANRYGVTLALGCAILAILGHSRSVFLGFKGGKSVATGAGTILGLSPVVFLAVLGIWIVVLALGRIVSLASVTAALSLPLFMLAFRQPLAYVLFGALAGAYVVIRHRANLVRLREGKEPKIGPHVSA